MSDSDLTLQNSLIRAPAITTQSAMAFILVAQAGFLRQPMSNPQLKRWVPYYPLFARYTVSNHIFISDNVTELVETFKLRIPLLMEEENRRQLDSGGRWTTGSQAYDGTSGIRTVQYQSLCQRSRLVRRCGTCHGWRVGTRGEFCLGR